MTLCQDVDALTAKDFYRRGRWYVHKRYGIEVLPVYHGENFCLYSWEYPGDLCRKLIGVRQSLDDALKLITQEIDDAR